MPWGRGGVGGTAPVSAGDCPARVADSTKTCCLAADGTYYDVGTKTSSRMAILKRGLQNLVNIGLAVWWYQWLGVRGLAFGHAASYLVASVLLYVMLRRRIGSLPKGSLGPGLARAAAAAPSHATRPSSRAARARLIGRPPSAGTRTARRASRTG